MAPAASAGARTIPSCASTQPTARRWRHSAPTAPVSRRATRSASSAATCSACWRPPDHDAGRSDPAVPDVDHPPGELVLQWLALEEPLELERQLPEVAV